MKTKLSYNETLSFSKKKMVWIIVLSAVVFLHCWIAGIFPLVPLSCYARITIVYP